MKLAKLSLRTKKPAERLAISRHVVNMMTGNTNFPDPIPRLDLISSAADELEIAMEKAIRGNTVEKRHAREKDAELLRMMSRIMNYVQAESGGSAEKILSAGMEVRRPSERNGLLAAPGGLRADYGVFGGEVKLSWKRRPGAKIYVAEYTGDIMKQQDNGGTRQAAEGVKWTNAGNTTRAKLTVKGLTPGTRYYFRVAAVNAAGKSGFSDLAMKMAP